jgi:predicted secreted protein
MFTFQNDALDKFAPAPKISHSKGEFPQGVSLAKRIFLLLALVIWPMTVALCQSQSSQQSQSPQQSQPQAQPQPPQKVDSVADAAKKAQKDKPKPKKVFTEDDLSGKSGGVSVVGEENKKGARRHNTDSDGDYEPNGEQYWRSRSQPILDQITATDQQIAQLKEDIKKYGSGGFDVTTGMKDNIAYIHDRNGQVQSLEKRKAALLAQLDELQEEGRKAGASPAWFR